MQLISMQFAHHHQRNICTNFSFISSHSIVLQSLHVVYDAGSAALCQTGLSDQLFAKGPNLVQQETKKNQILRQGPKKGPIIFSKFISSYKVLFLEHQYQPVSSFLLTAAILVYPYLQQHCLCTLHQ